MKKLNAENEDLKTEQEKFGDLINGDLKQVNVNVCILYIIINGDTNQVNVNIISEVMMNILKVTNYKYWSCILPKY